MPRENEAPVQLSYQKYIETTLHTGTAAEDSAVMKEVVPFSQQQYAGEGLKEATPSARFQELLRGASIHVPKEEEVVSEFSTGFDTKKLSTTKRSVKSKTKGTALHKKKKNAEQIGATEAKHAAAQQAMLEKLQENLPVENTLPDFIAKGLTAFMGGTLEEDQALFADINAAEGTEEQEKALSHVTMLLLNTDLSNIDFSNDEALVKSAERIETIADRYQTVMGLATTNRTFFETKLDEETQKLLKLKLDQMSRILGYYNTRKILIQNDYYQTHYNSEMSVFDDGHLTSAQADVQTLIRLNRQQFHVLMNGTLPEVYADFEEKLGDEAQVNEWRLMVNQYQRTTMKQPGQWGGSGDIACGAMQLASWIMRDKRSTNHGAQRFAEMEAKLQTVSSGLKDMHFQDLTWQRGSAAIAPELNLSDLYRDPVKTKLRSDLLTPPDPANDDVIYGLAIRALEYYVKVPGVGNADTVEMEMTFLDTFRQSYHYLTTNPSVQLTQEQKTFLDTAYTDVLAKSAGGLQAKMDAEEFAYVVQNSQILVEDTTFLGNMRESNIKDIPLFTHTPNMNDVKQSTIGDCWLVAAMTTLVKTNPEAVRDMFQDLGDGSVLVRLYTAYDMDGKPIADVSNLTDQRTDVSFKPAYFRVAKHFETGDGNATDCVWPQLLEKAYAVAGYNVKGKVKISEDGMVSNVAEELTNGTSTNALAHFLGHTISQKSISMKEYTSLQVLNAPEMKYFLQAGIPMSVYNSFISMAKELPNADITEMTEMMRNAAGIYVASVKEYVYSLQKKMREQQIGEREISSVVSDYLKSLGINSTVNEESGRFETDPTFSDQIADRFRQNLQAVAAGTVPERSKIDDPLMNLNQIKSQIETLMSTFSEEMTKEERVESLREQIQLFSTIADPNYEANSLQYVQGIFGSGQRVDFQEQVDSIKHAGVAIATSTQGAQYSVGDRSFLRDLQDTIQAGGSVAFSAPHFMCATDVRLKNGKWFVLVKDPFNVYNCEYTQTTGANGAAVTEKKEEGFKKVLSLSGNAKKRHFAADEEAQMHGSFRGTSWWELHDLVQEVVFYNCLKRADT